MRKPDLSWRWSVAVAATVAVSVLGAYAFANHQPGHKVFKGRSPLKTVAVSSTEEFLVDGNDWTDIPGAKATIKVPAGKQALIIARFTAETVCYDISPDHCSARIMIGGNQGHPASGRDFHIDSNYGGETNESEKAHAMDRSLQVGSGKHVVKVQVAAMGNTALRVDDWSLTVESIGR